MWAQNFQIECNIVFHKDVFSEHMISLKQKIILGRTVMAKINLMTLSVVPDAYRDYLIWLSASKLAFYREEPKV